MGILSASSPFGQLLGIDLDNQALSIARKRLSVFGERAHIVNGSYVHMIDYLKIIGWNCVDGILMDLGLSSLQLDTAKRGFSFKKDAPLDMRFNQQAGKTAAEILNTSSKKDIAAILWTFGEEPRSRQIASAIVNNRPIRTTKQLSNLILAVYHGKRGKIHPATRTFQGLRIAVNNELEILKRGLNKALEAVCPGGRIIFITFHSLEDRLVKNYFQRESKDCICPPEQIFCNCGHKARIKIITKKVVKPSQEEITNNPRARSAKLRVAEKI